MADRDSKSVDELQEFRRFLGPAAKEYTDTQLQQLRREMQAMAKLLLDIHLWKKDQGQRSLAAGPRSRESPPPFDNEGHRT